MMPIDNRLRQFLSEISPGPRLAEEVENRVKNGEPKDDVYKEARRKDHTLGGVADLCSSYSQRMPFYLSHAVLRCVSPGRLSDLQD